jgi:hypothetical protein
MPPASSASTPPPSPRPRQWEKWALYSYLRMMGSTQKEAGSAVGRKKRTVAEWEEAKALFAEAREEARKRWLTDLTDASRQTLLTTIRGGAGELALKVLERTDPDLAPATQRHKIEHEVGEGLSGLLKAFGGHDADAG